MTVSDAASVQTTGATGTLVQLEAILDQLHGTSLLRLEKFDAGKCADCGLDHVSRRLLGRVVLCRRCARRRIAAKQAVEVSR